jgi:hypothetical protein
VQGICGTAMALVFLVMSELMRFNVSAAVKAGSNVLITIPSSFLLLSQGKAFPTCS